MTRPGDICFCEEVEGDPTSKHWWIILYIDDDVVQYMTATARIEPFIYREHPLKVLRNPIRHPDSAVFLDVGKVKGLDGSQIFPDNTVLNCHHPPSSIPLHVFTLRDDRSQLKQVGRLPDRYLAQIIPSARCGRWSRADIKRVLDSEYGIGGRIDAFYNKLRQ